MDIQQVSVPLRAWPRQLPGGARSRRRPCARARMLKLGLGLAAAAGVVLGGALPAAANPALEAGGPLGGWMVGLQAQAPTIANGAPDTLTAQASADVSGTGLRIEIYNRRTGKLIASCAQGTTCSVTRALTATTQSYLAYVGSPSPTAPPGNVQAQSGMTYVTWSSAGVTIQLDAFPAAPGSSTWIIETEASNSAPGGYHVGIFDETTGQALNVSSGQTPYVSVSISPGGPVSPGDSLVAFIATYNKKLQPVTIIASSNTVLAPV